MTKLPISNQNGEFKALNSLSSAFPGRPSRLLPQRFISILASSAAIALSLWATPSFAGDPFRATNPHKIGNTTEAAFKAIFEQGNYKAAKQYLNQVEPNEPLAYGMKAAIAYMEKDWAGVSSNATRTRETAEQLLKTDPLRGNIYIGVGEFMEGAYILSSEGTVRGTPKALNKLQRVFQALNAAEKISPQDPELNLIKGFMDLMLSVNLPFSNPADAVQRLDKYAMPRYLAYRGIALGYRDLNQQDKALKFVDQALQLTPNNPDLYYLKAQVLVRQGKNQESLEFFQKALAKNDQLPTKLRNQIAYESCRTENRIDNKARTCSAELRN